MRIISRFDLSLIILTISIQSTSSGGKELDSADILEENVNDMTYDLALKDMSNTVGIQDLDVEEPKENEIGRIDEHSNSILRQRKTKLPSNFNEDLKVVTKDSTIKDTANTDYSTDVVKKESMDVSKSKEHPSGLSTSMNGEGKESELDDILEEDISQITYESAQSNATQEAGVSKEIDQLEEHSRATLRKEEDRIKYSSTPGGKESDLDDILDEEVTDMTYDVIKNNNIEGINGFDVIKEDSIEKSIEMVTDCHEGTKLFHYQNFGVDKEITN